MRLRSLGILGCMALSCASIFAAAGACSSTSTPVTAADSGTSGGNNGDITIGFSNSLTGGLNGLGVPLNDAAKVAEQQVNQVGVLGGRHIAIDIQDDLSDPTNGVLNAANHFISESVPAVLGPLSSGEALAVDLLYAKHKIVEISPSATSPALTDAQAMTDRYFFRTAPADDFQGKAVAKLIYDGVLALSQPDAGAADDGGTTGPAMIGGGCKNAYLVNGDDGYGNGLMAVVSTTFTGKGGTILGQDTVSTTLAPDYKLETAKVVAANPDCLVLVTYSDVGAQFMRDLRTAMNAPAGTPLKFPVYGSDGEYDSAFIPNGETIAGTQTSPNVVQGVVGTTPDPAPATTEYQVFHTIWQSSHPNTEPPAYSANLYDAILVLALAIEQSKSATDGQAIRDALYKVTNGTSNSFGPDKFVAAEAAIDNGSSVKYIGASGPMTFDQYGNVTGDYIVWSVGSQANCSTPSGCFTTVGRITSDEL
jgi:ABC-type branched-subunit amino acid transport system substrate-binding protein